MTENARRDSNQPTEQQGRVPIAVPHITWRQPVVIHRHFHALVFLCGSMVFGIACIVAILLNSFFQPNTRFLILNGTADQAKTSDLMEIDIPALLARASSNKLRRLLEERYPAAIISPLQKKPFELHAEFPKQAIDAAVHSKTTLIVYLNGILPCFDGTTLVESSRAAHGKPTTNHLIQAIRELRECPCQQVLLLVDVIPVPSIGPSKFAQPLAFDQFRDLIEEELQRSNGTPIAVHLRMSSTGKSIPLIGSTMLVDSICKTFQSESNKGKVSVQKLMTSIASLDAKDFDRNPHVRFIGLYLTIGHWRRHGSRCQSPPFGQKKQFLRLTRFGLHENATNRSPNKTIRSTQPSLIWLPRQPSKYLLYATI